MTSDTNLETRRRPDPLHLSMPRIDNLFRQAEGAGYPDEHEMTEMDGKLQRQIDESKRREERAAQAERDRIAAERQSEDKERAKREADKKHRARIKNEIAKSLATMVEFRKAEAIADALLFGAIPHCRVSL